MADDSDVPPLEDMSDLLQRAETLREVKDRANKRGQSTVNGTQVNGHSHKTSAPASISSTKSESTAGPAASSNKKSDSQSQTSVKQRGNTQSLSTNQPASGGFGGMKKGFMFGGSKPDKKPSQTVTKTEARSVSTGKGATNQTLEDIPFIKKQEDAETDRFKFTEVQEAMKNATSQLMENKDQWATDDLLEKIEGSKSLSQQLQDPRFAQAIAEFQANPQQALLKYQNNQEVQQFLKDFCGIMGEHFSKLGDKADPRNVAGQRTSSSPQVLTKEPDTADLSVRSSTNPKQPTSEDEAKMKDILSSPEIQTVLMDPRIQSLFETLRTNPNEGQRQLQQADPDLRQKIHKLVSAGLLQVETR